MTKLLGVLPGIVFGAAEFFLTKAMTDRVMAGKPPAGFVIGKIVSYAAVLLPVTKLGVHDLVRLLIMVPAGAAIYVGGSLLLKLESFSYVLDIAKKLLHRGKENP